MKPFRKAMDLCLRRQVREEQDRSAVGGILRDFRAHEVRARSVTAYHNDLRATFRQQHGGGQAEAAGRPSNDDRLPAHRYLAPCWGTQHVPGPKPHFNFRNRSTLSAAPPKARARLSFATLCAKTLLI